jgi:hypothetical protein
MQCPPTNPGLKGKKIPFAAAAAKTACVSICIKLNILEFVYKAHNVPWEFSITLAALLL